MALTKPPGEWRHEDLERLTDDGKRYEIVEGVLYEMPSPSGYHALTIRNLMFLLGPVIEALGGWLVSAPPDVFFQGADPVQPDLVVLLPDGMARYSAQGVKGAPDLLIEVLSPSNRGHDRLTKRARYARAGVREHWIVDPEARTVDILALDRDAFHSLQTAFEDDDILSPLLGGATFPAAGIFARCDEVED